MNKFHGAKCFLFTHEHLNQTYTDVCTMRKSCALSTTW